MQDFFTMMMMLDCTNMNGNFDELRSVLTEEGKKLGVDIKIQREEIFKSMHSL